MAEAHHSRRPTSLAAALLACALGAPSAVAMPLGYTELNVIGDSLSDQGRFAAINEAEGGPGLAPRYNPVTDRFTSRTVWADQFGAANPGLTINNTAIGGAFVNDNTIPGFGLADNAADVDSGAPQAALDGVQAQLAGIDSISSDATTLLWAGANDIVFIGAPGVAGGSTSAEDFLGALVAGIASSIDQLIAKGANPDYIYVGNTPSLNLTPLGNANGPEGAALFQALSSGFNAGLASVASAKGVNVIDFATAIQASVANPASLGVTDAVNPCVGLDGSICSNPDERFFWDSLHPSSTVHAEIARLITVATTRDVVETPTPTTSLLVAFGLLALSASRARRR